MKWNDVHVHVHATTEVVMVVLEDVSIHDGVGNCLPLIIGRISISEVVATVFAVISFQHSLGCHLQMIQVLASVHLFVRDACSKYHKKAITVDTITKILDWKQKHVWRI